MGGNRVSSRSWIVASVALLGVLPLSSCDDDDTTAGVVGSADAITAAVAWQASEQEPLVADDGEVQLPVIYVVADGSSFDVGTQAAVAEATVDWATVRFADDIAEAFDENVEGEPVRDDGAMLLVGPIPEPAQSIELTVVRYTSLDDGVPVVLEIVSEPAPEDTSDVPAPRATVTSATQP